MKQKELIFAIKNKRHLRASMKEIDLKNIAIPIIGTGNQGIPVTEVVPVLIKQCITAFQTIDALCSISIFGLRPDFLPVATQCLNEIVINNYTS